MFRIHAAVAGRCVYKVRGLVLVDGDGGGGGGGDAVADQEGVDGGVFAAEVAVEACGMTGASALEDVVAEGVGGSAVEDTVFLEVGESVGVEHFGPFIGVIAGGIASGEDVAEGGAGHRSFDGFEDLDGFHGLALELHGVGHGSGGGVPCHVEVAETELTHAGVAGAELRGLHKFLDELVGEFLTGLIVAGEGVEKLALGEVVLVELRGEFDEVAVDGGTRKRSVLALRQQSVEGVAEFMEESLDLIGCEQRGGVGRGLGEVHHDGYLRTVVDALGGDALVLEAGHPGAGALGVAREEVGVDHADKLPLVVGNVEGLHVGMVYLDVVVAGELQSVKLGGEAEHTGNHVVELEVGTQLLLVVAVGGIFELVGVVAVVPRIDFHRFALGFGGKFGQFGHLALESGLIGVAELVEKLVDVFGRLGHGALERVLGVVLRAEQLGNLEAHGGYAAHILYVGVFALGIAARVEAVEALAQVGTVGILHEGHIGRLGEREEKLTLAAFGLGKLCSLIDNPLGKSGEVVGGEPYLVGVQLLEYILTENGGKLRELGAELAVSIAVGTFEVGAGECEGVVGLLEEHSVLRIEIEAVALLVNGLHALPERSVERNGGTVVAELGRYAHGDFHHLVVGVGRQKGIEHVEHAVEVGTGALESHDSVLESRFLGIIGDFLDFGLREGDATVDGRLVGGVGEAGEWRCLMHGGKRLLQRILC